MPNIPIPLKGIELRGDLIAQLESFMRPLALRSASAAVEALEAQDGPFLDLQLIPARLLLSEGGRFEWWRITVKARDDIEYFEQFFSGGSIPPSLVTIFDGATTAALEISDATSTYAIELHLDDGDGSVTITAPQEEVRDLATTLESIFSSYQPEVVPLPARPFKVFIAFGGSLAWEVVRDYLRRADIQVDAFNDAERVGEVTIDVVSKMIHSASVAVIVMTSEDQLKDGTWHARQNVIHETGYANGVLGVRNTIVLKEDGVVMPSNLANVTYIPFPRGSVHTTEARVVARVREAKADFEAS